MQVCVCGRVGGCMHACACMRARTGDYIGHYKITMD